MKLFYTDHFVLPLPAEHRFPMRKYALLRERVAAAALGSLLVPPAADDVTLGRAHDADYIRRVREGRLTRDEVRRIGFPWSPEMVERSRRSSGATVEACRAALDDGCGVNLAGGTHHAFRDRGEGYCVFNDSVVAARAMQAEGRAHRVVVLDCDVHQGNGTAALAAGDLSIFAFSIHSARNYPLKKEVSDLDVPLEDGTEDAGYLDALEVGLARALPAARADLAIYLAGADPYFGDRFGRLRLTKRGLAERDRMVFDRCWVAGIPVAVTMAGGYAPAVEDIVDIHFQTVQEAARRAGSGRVISSL
jgi:acetoin utilization deacetylase AcuC-like enzyme